MKWTPLLLFVFLLPADATLNEQEASSLVSLKGSLKGRLTVWNASDDPCVWKGVTCDPSNDTVLSLRLSGMGLVGRLPPSLAAHKNLRILSLRFNSLAGNLPPELGAMTALRVLNLEGNLFAGNIPFFLFGLRNLVKLNLAENQFHGSLPKDFEKLTKLQELYLERNRFTGGLPEAQSLASVSILNVTGNNLTGKIPQWARKFPVEAFRGNRLCGAPLIPCKKKRLSAWAIAAIVVGGVLVLLLIVVLVVLPKKRMDKVEKKRVEKVEKKRVEKVEKKKRDGSGSVREREIPGGMETRGLVLFGSEENRFDLEDLLRASAEVLGKGTFGTTYKANVEGGDPVVVKRLKEVRLSNENLAAKLSLIGKMSHENFVPLKGYYLGKDEKLLVYDYFPMGSLSALLHGNRERGKTPLNWTARARILIGAAAGIEYIHAQSPNISHGNLRSSNILVTNGFFARVSDSLLSQIATPAVLNSRVDGFRAPDVSEIGKDSQKEDVYSLGVVILEMLTGKAESHSPSGEEGADLARWVQTVVRTEWTAEVFDEELVRYQGLEEEMVEMLQLAVDCTAGYSEARPSVAEVRKRMEEICRASLEVDRSDSDAV